MFNHVCLVFTPIDHRYQDALSHFAPPLGLVALANYVNRILPSVKVTILDGSVKESVSSICAFLDRERPDLVGQSIQLISYPSALKIAEHAKALGLCNVMGGHHATQLAPQIAAARDGIVDYVVTGDGEMAFAGLLQGREVHQIPNLVFAHSGTVKSTLRQPFNLHHASKIDYSGVDFSPYARYLDQSAFTQSVAGRYLRVYSHKGCGNRGNSSACVFCGRADDRVRFKRPEHFWADVLSVVEEHGATYVFDVGDDFLCSEKWVQAVADSRPSFSTRFELGIFGRANRVNAKVAAALSKIGVSDVVIGFESGDDEVLRRSGKKDTTAATNIEAAYHLFSNGIDVTASFVLGLPGENPQTLDRTVAAATKIVDLSHTLLGRPPREMVANLIEPSPGSPAYSAIVRAMPEKYQSRDVLSLEELQRDYFKCYFGLDDHTDYDAFRTDLRRAAANIHSLVPFADAQGWLDGEGPPAGGNTQMTC